MYKRLSLALLCLFNLALFAQVDEDLSAELKRKKEVKEVQTLFNSNTHFGAYLGLNTKGCEIAGEPALLTGGEVAVVLGRSFNLGFAGYGLVASETTNNFDSNGEELHLYMGYGGLHIEPVLMSENLVHVTFPVLLGVGAYGESQHGVYFDDGEFFIEPLAGTVSEEVFLVAEPGVNMELNVFKFMRLAAGASYRFISSSDIGNFQSSDFEGFNGNISLRLGWF